MRVLVFGYGLVAYLCFFATILYAIGFVGNYFVPRSLDRGVEAPLLEAILVNAGLLALFAIQHTIMARPGFKARITRFIPKAAERSTFVILASACLALAMWQWRTIGGTLWHTDIVWLRNLLIGISLAGWGLVFYSSFLIDHFDLFGLRQVWLYLRKKDYTHHPFAERSAYKLVRHPLMLGFLIASWATPTMTGGHLLFALLITGYVLVGIRFEERDLVRLLGEPYVEYRRRTPALLPFGRRKPAEDGTGGDRRAAWLRRIGAAGFLFFLGKGIVWLVVTVLLVRGW